MSNNPTRIAPNNQFPATHFIEVWNRKGAPYVQYKDKHNVTDMLLLESFLGRTAHIGDIYTTAIFKIRPNQVPCKHQDLIASASV